MSRQNRLNDEKWMRRALRLALKGKGWTSPNPCVGAVIVRNGRIVGEGFHPKTGEPHAETIALKSAGPRAKGSTIYVNLEPCCHVGRTPPCTDALIAAEVSRVVAAICDPDPRVNGCGLDALRKANIECISGVLEEEAKRLNESFIKFVTTQHPFTTLKLAMSLDGKIATRKGESQWITGPDALKIVHRMRHEHDAVMVGINTVITDNPRLTCRLPGRHKQPHRIIVDSTGRIPVDARCLQTADTTQIFLATTRKAPARALRNVEDLGVRTIRTDVTDRGVDLNELMTQLSSQSITSVLIEGGGQLAASALQSGIVDKVIFLIAPMIIGGANAIPAVSGTGIERLADAWQLKNVTVRRAGKDIVVEGYVDEKGVYSQSKS